MASDVLLRNRIIRVLSKHGPMKAWQLRRLTSSYVSNGDDYWRVLEEMVIDGSVWHEAGIVKMNGHIAVPSKLSRKHSLPESSSIHGASKAS